MTDVSVNVVVMVVKASAVVTTLVEVHVLVVETVVVRGHAVTVLVLCAVIVIVLRSYLSTTP